MNMPKFRKKPVVIEAIQWNNNPQEVMAFHSSMILRSDGSLFIGTLEGTMHVSDKDWIIKGVNGEFYPCKPDIFEKTYEKVED